MNDLSKRDLANAAVAELETFASRAVGGWQNGDMTTALRGLDELRRAIPIIEQVVLGDIKSAILRGDLQLDSYSNQGQE